MEQAVELTPMMDRFILHWGEMGARWGVNRSVAQVHALLYLSPRPLHAEEITETLQIARSNVSTSIKELQAWGLVKLTHVKGDRRDHFEALKDNWTILTTIVEERKKREIDPTLSVLRSTVLDGDDDDKTDPEVKEQVAELLRFLETLSGWYDQIKDVPKPTLVTLMKMGSKVARFVRR